MKITIAEIKKICFAVFEKYGVSKKDGELIFAEYLDAELSGITCHGFSAFAKFGAKTASDKKVKLVIKKNKPAYTLVDAKNNLGQLVCKDAVNLTIKKARKQGIAMLGIYNMHSYLMPGTYAKQAANQDMIAIITNYGGGPRIAPYGSIDPILGVNPLAIGIPANNFPIVLDMATAQIAMGKVRLAKKLGQLLPQGIAIDANGKPTTNPAKAMSGAMLPFGGYKGSGLAFCLELLTKTLFNLDDKDQKEDKRGFLFIIINPSIFGDVKKFKNRTAKLVQEIKHSRKAKGVKEIFLPGEQAYRNRQNNLKKKYLEIDEKIINEIKSLL
ncbi:MAG: Ldh family oxidoreductase [Candidatus Buchananbacteria bacterium]